MTDRKKVIASLGNALVQMHGCGRYTPEDVDELETAAWKVLKLLEEQETTYAYNEYTNPACTSCGFRPFAGYIPTLKWMKERGYRYCPCCGKAVKWDG
jgi:hypothetical protein